MNATRCFVGIELTDDVRDTLVDAGAVLRSTDNRWVGEKWVAPHNLHLTLAFLGNVADRDADLLRHLLGEALRSTQPAHLRLTGIQAVRTLRRASMVWGVFADPAGRAARLAAAVAVAVEPLGIAPESRPFSPHVTLARARRPHALSDEALRAADEAVRGAAASMSVPSATLFSSTLSRTGPTYDVIERWSLGG